jgi:hypothetical protein
LNKIVRTRTSNVFYRDGGEAARWREDETMLPPLVTPRGTSTTIKNMQAEVVTIPSSKGVQGVQRVQDYLNKSTSTALNSRFFSFRWIGFYLAGFLKNPFLKPQ